MAAAAAAARGSNAEGSLNAVMGSLPLSTSRPLLITGAAPPLVVVVVIALDDVVDVDLSLVAELLLGEGDLPLIFGEELLLWWLLLLLGERLTTEEGLLGVLLPSGLLFS